eukprot:3940461-Rhodomonas_salina.5
MREGWRGAHLFTYARQIQGREKCRSIRLIDADDVMAERVSSRARRPIPGLRCWLVDILRIFHAFTRQSASSGPDVA